MYVKFCDLQKNYLSIKDEVNTKINEILCQCNYVLGKDVSMFENNFASYIGMKHCIGVGNGTDALEIAVSSLGLPEDSEIIVQGNTYIATCFGVINNLHKLVLCDVDKNTHMIDLADLEKKITKKTKAIMVVHLYGFMLNMNQLIEICNRHNLLLIEDCAQSHGASYDGKKAGSFGKISCFSFYPSKNLGAYGDGGCIMTNDDVLGERIRKKANLGSKIKYHHDIIGRNSRLDNIQAAVLNVKLKYLDENNCKRNKFAKIYDSYLKNNPNIWVPDIENKCNPVYHLYVIRARERSMLQKYLIDHGVETLIHYPIPLCKTNAFKGYVEDDNPNVVELCDEIISLPMYPELEEKEVLYVCQKINEFYDTFDNKNHRANTSNSRGSSSWTSNNNQFTTVHLENKPGDLHCINSLNFSPVKRMFYIDGFENNELPVKRGDHSIMNFNEFLLILEGKIKLTLTNQKKEKEEFILSKNDTHIIKSKTWIEYEVLDNSTKILVLCDKEYSESIKIHDFHKFINEPIDQS